jgi:hypothetical protein
MFPPTFASAAFAPAASMPGWLQPFVEAKPDHGVTEALRALTTGGPAISPGAVECRLGRRPHSGLRTPGHPAIPPTRLTPAHLVEA